MAISKIIYKSSSSAQGETWMDLTQDTVSDANHIRNGYVGHLNDGTSATGSYSGTSPTLTTKSITANGTYNASSDNADGYSSVTVNVSGGGTSAQIATGSVTGDGTTTLAISCNFEPDFIYVYGDMSASASNRGVVSITILKDTFAYMSNDSSTSNTNENFTIGDHSISGYGDPTNLYATYSNGALTIDAVSNTSARRFRSGQTYTYKLVKWT